MIHVVKQGDFLISHSRLEKNCRIPLSLHMHADWTFQSGGWTDEISQSELLAARLLSRVSHEGPGRWLRTSLNAPQRGHSMHDSKTANIILIVVLVFMGISSIVKASKPSCLAFASCFNCRSLCLLCSDCMLVLPLSSLVDHLLLEEEGEGQAGSKTGQLDDWARSFSRGRQDN